MKKTNNRTKLSLSDEINHPLVRSTVQTALNHYGLSDVSAIPLARGGQGIVFTVQNKNGISVLLKVPSYGTRPLEEYWLLEHNLSKEAAILGELDCKAVPQLLNYDSKGCYIFREFVDGERLSDLYGRIHPNLRVTLLNALYFVAKMLFDAFHNSKRGCYVIRDFKPANLIVDIANHDMKLIDVGSARPEADMVSRTPRPYRLGSGKWLYWAPEQLLERVEGLDRKADYFSFGATAFFILTGDAPYSNSEAEPDKVMDIYLSRYKEVSQIVRKKCKTLWVAEEMASFLIACLHPIPAERPKNFEI